MTNTEAPSPTAHDVLWPLALRRHPRCGSWHGQSGGKELCYVCDEVIDTWSTKWPRPKHVDAAIIEYAAMHLAELVSTRP